MTGFAITSALCSSAQSQGHKLELVDLVCEGEDEALVEGQALTCALLVVEELYQCIGQLMP